MSNYAMVLSDSLYRELHDFKHGNTVDTGKIENLLNLLQMPVLTSVEQLKRLNIDNSPLRAGLASSGWISQTVEELAVHTLYKIVLNETDERYPFVNIFKDRVKSSFSMTFFPGENRQKAIKYIQAQLKQAGHIFVYDKYLDDNWSNTKKFFNDLVPRKKLNVYYTDEQLSRTHISELKGMCNEWYFAADRLNSAYRNLHDRYLLIDSRLEIILTSGFDNLFDLRTECTMVFRQLKKSTGD
ncbi:MAG: hypothetical protein GQF41_0474 [Candidatus Rifleibacterium amylolyticum]|nr:MAG: hypothetical protein GQF41_0474 [Candidatus Rifleibacterium amylolyticum]